MIELYNGNKELVMQLSDDNMRIVQELMNEIPDMTIKHVVYENKDEIILDNREE